MGWYRFGIGKGSARVSIPTSLVLGAAALALTFGPAALDAAPSPEPKMQSTPRSASDLVSIRLSSDTTRIGPRETFHLIFEFTIKPDWHIYWKNPGETGAPTTFDIKGPEYEIGEPIFARPQCIDAPDGLTYGYEERAVVVVPITAPEQIGDGHVRFVIDINYLVCKEFCLIGRPSLEIEINTSSTPTGHKNTLDELSTLLDASFPKPLEKLERASAEFDGTALTVIAPTLDDDQKTAFFPMETPGVTYGKPRLVFRDRLVHIIVPAQVKPENALGEALRIAGLIALGEDPRKPCYEFDLPVDVSDAPQVDSTRN